MAYVVDLGPLFLVPLVPSVRLAPTLGGRPCVACRHANGLQLASCIVLAIDRPSSTPGTLLVLQGVVLLDQLLFLLAVPELLQWPYHLAWALETALTVASLLIVMTMPMRDPSLGCEGIASPFEPASHKKRSPEDNLSLWHWMTVAWMNPLIQTARSKRLDDEDIWLLPYQFQHERLFRLFREIRGSVTARIFKANAPDLFITTGLGILESATNVLSIVLLKPLLAALERGHRDIRAAVVYATLILLVNLVRAQSTVFSYWYTRRCYERSRGEMITMIYDKTLRRKAFTIPSQHQDQAGGGADSAGEDGTKAPPASTGKILNLMRNDVYEVSQRFWDFPTFVTKPLDIILSVILVWQILGPAALLGILVLVVALVLNYFIVKVMVKFEVQRRRVMDLKLQVTTQFIEAIRHLRWYDWQDKWLGDILTHRQKELHLRVIRGLLRRAIVLLNQLAAAFFPVAAFYAYTIIGGRPLAVEVAFPALNLFSLLDNSVSQIPDMITSLLDAAVAMRRIESFMVEADKAGSHGLEETAPPAAASEIIITKGTFAWPGVTIPILTEVDLHCKAGLTLVCGKVGTGKTALLQAILGEMDQHHGERTVPKEMIGYCAQLPWLQSMSIKDNILFCAPYDKARFDQVIDACCLRQDLAEFDAGENSFVGENGVGLSGGQKARVALARAVYSRARILLLDDPIAALDHQTAETILWRLFSSSQLMRDRLVIFVTHRVDLVTKYSDQVAEIKEDGRLSCFRPKDLSSDENLLERVTSGNSHAHAPGLSTTNDTDDGVPKKFIEEEHRAHGGVVASVYWRYIKAGSVGWWMATILLFVGFRIAKVAYFYYLKVWGEAYGPTRSDSLVRLTAASLNGDAPARPLGWFDNIDLGLPPPEQNPRPWLFWLAIIAIGPLVTRALSLLTLLVVQYTAGKKMFHDLMVRVSNAPFRFFDVTPVGRLMNRVTSDVGTIDGQIPDQIYNTALSLLNWGSAMIVIASTTPIFLLLAILMSATFAVVFQQFLPASQSLRRLETTSLSPLMSNFGTIVEGLTTVRAFRAQPHFQQQNIATTDDFQKMDHFYWSLQAWLQLRYDALSALSTFALTITALRLGLSGGTVGFVLAAAANFVDSTHNLCKRYGALQMQFVSVERVVELLDLEPEAAGDVVPPAAWPTANDDIVFDDVSIRYAAELDPVLRNVSLRIPAGSTVAVTGRTGSGKTTLALALLGTVLPDYAPDAATRGPQANGGSRGAGIFIGGVDVARVDKHTLRRRVSFVAQDPVLFLGSLRANLDPMGEHSDHECASVLARVMSDIGDFTIHSRVDGGGKNLSQGQRQLVGLGRALLRRSPIVILDEVSS